MCLNFYHKWRSQTWKIAFVKGEGIFQCYHFGQNTSGVLCLWRVTDQVCLEQNDFFWHPWPVWKFVEARLRLWAFRACTGCKSWVLVKCHLEPKWSSRCVQHLTSTHMILVAVDCIAMNYWCKHKRNVAIRCIKLTGKQPAAIELPHWVHSTPTRLHYHYIGIRELR